LARGVPRQAARARASATDDSETLATALEELITSRVDKMSKKMSGAA
jgi:cell division protein ZapA